MHPINLAIWFGLITSAFGQGTLGGDQSSCTGTNATFVHSGCYADADNDLHMAYKFLISSDPNSIAYYPTFSTASMTVESCTEACRGHGFEFAAPYNGTDCYCGSQLPDSEAQISTADGPAPNTGNNPGATTSPSACSLLCPGSSTETCGGPAAADVYVDPSFSSSSAAAAAQNFLYLGCFTNTRPGPLFVSLETPATSDCAAYCGQLSFSYMGRSGYNSQTSTATCACGTEVQTGNQVDESYCSYYCNGSTNAL